MKRMIPLTTTAMLALSSGAAYGQAGTDAIGRVRRHANRSGHTFASSDNQHPARQAFVHGPVASGKPDSIRVWVDDQSRRFDRAVNIRGHVEIVQHRVAGHTRTFTGK